MPERFRFLVDEAALRQAAGRGAIELSEAFDGLVRLIQEVRAHRIGKLSDVWEEQLGQHCLCDWLFDRALGIDRDTATALQVALARTPDWDVAWDTAGLSKQVIVAGVEQEAFSASAAARETREGRATACLSVVPSRSGRLRVTSPEHSTELHFIALSNDEVPVLAFFRDVPEVEKLDEDAYFDNAQFAFPNINFVRDRTRFGHFNEGYDTIRGYGPPLGAQRSRSCNSRCERTPGHEKSKVWVARRRGKRRERQYEGRQQGNEAARGHRRGEGRRMRLAHQAPAAR